MMFVTDVHRQLIRGERDFRGKNLSGLDLRGLDFSAVDFTEANLRDANCTGCTFRDAIFTGATLSGGIFLNADFTGAVSHYLRVSGIRYINNNQLLYLTISYLRSNDPLPDLYHPRDFFN